MTIRHLLFTINSMAGTLSRVIKPILSVVLEDGSIKLYFEVIKSGLESEKATLRHSQVINYLMSPLFCFLDF